MKEVEGVDNKNLGLSVYKRTFAEGTAALRNICNASLYPPLQIIKIRAKNGWNKQNGFVARDVKVKAHSYKILDTVSMPNT